MSTVADIASDKTEPPPSSIGVSAKRRWLSSPQVVFWLPALAMILVAMLRNLALFTTPQYEGGDAALDSLLVLRAEHFEQLVGNYSRVGFHHPGPALLYMLAAGQAFFHGLLGVPTDYNGQLLGCFVYTATFIALTLVSLFRLTRSRGAVILAFGVIFSFAASHQMFGVPWFPYLYMPAFLLFTVSAAGLVAGRTSELVLYVLSGATLVHGHISFFLFVVATTAVAGLCWLKEHRRNLAGELRLHRRGLIGAAILFVLFLLPMVLNVILHYPGEWGKYKLYVLHNGNTPRTSGQVLHFAAYYWSGGQMPVTVTVIACVSAVVLTATERDLGRRKVFLALYSMVALQTLLFLYYVLRGVDVLNSTTAYVGDFYKTIPVIFVATALAQLWIRLVEVGPVRGALSSAWMRGIPAVVILAGFAVIAVTPTTNLRRDTSIDSNYKEAAKTMLASADVPVGGRVLVTTDSLLVWPGVAGVALQLQRDGVRWCLNAPTDPWANLFTSTYMCPTAGLSGTTIHFAATADVPPGATVIWRGQDLLGTKFAAYL